MLLCYGFVNYYEFSTPRSFWSAFILVGVSMSMNLVVWVGYKMGRMGMRWGTIFTLSMTDKTFHIHTHQYGGICCLFIYPIFQFLLISFNAWVKLK